MPGTTVMAMGGSLANATVELVPLGTDGAAAAATVSPPPAAARVVGSWDGSIQFLLPGPGGPTRAYRFRACSGAGGPPNAACSGWRTVNVPDVMWAVGDASANATAVVTQGGWLKVYGRSLGFTASGACAASTVANSAPAMLSSSIATLTQLGGEKLATALPVSAASCYDATMAVPADTPAGEYNLTIANHL